MEKKNTDYRRHNIGSVSSGTMLLDDLIPCFLDTLKNQSGATKADRALIKSVQTNIDTMPEYYGSEDATFDLEELFDALEGHAPEGFYFGAHPGDGADYGFWLSEGFFEDFDGLWVSDLSAVPDDYAGDVLVVNDHGNQALYSQCAGETIERWSIV